jgi:hypothetical protein
LFKGFEGFAKLFGYHGEGAHVFLDTTTNNVILANDYYDYFATYEQLL